MYTGTPGSGKSLHVARYIYRELLMKRRIIANFDINETFFKKKRHGFFLHMDNSDLTPEKLMAWAVCHHRRSPSGHIVEGQTTIILDECQILFNSREWNMKDRLKWCTFFTQHRKYGYNVILITQFDRLIDRQIRSLVEYEVKHRKVSNFKTLGAFLGLLFGGNLFVAVTTWYGMKEKISSEFFVGRKRYFAMYDSFKIFGSAQTGGQGGPGGRCQSLAGDQHGKVRLLTQREGCAKIAT